MANKPTYEELLNENKRLKSELNKYQKSGLNDIDNNNINFNDLFDIDEIQKIQDLFAEATGVASIITYPDGTPISKPSNFCRLCTDIIRKTEKGLKNCYHSDSEIGKLNTKGAVYQPCLSGGLWDGGASISVGDKHIANWLIGQVKNEQLDEKKMLLYAKEIGADETEFKNALDEVTIMPVKQFKKIADILFYFANEISQKAYNNLIQKQSIIELQKKEEQLIKAKEQAIESENRISAMLNAIPDIFFRISDEGTFIDYKATQKDLYYQESSIIGKKYADILPPELVERMNYYIPLVLKTGKIQHYEYDLDIQSAKSYFEARLAKSGAKEVTAIVRDITERKKAEEELHKSNLFVNSLLRAIPVAVFFKDKEGKYLGCNDVFSEIFGISADAIKGKTVNDLWPDDQSHTYLENDLALLKAGQHQIYEYTITDKNGDVRPAIFVKDVFMDAQGEPAGIVGAFLDITDRKKNEELLRIKNIEYEAINEELKHTNEKLVSAKEHAEESDRLKTAFLQNMSHEIRTPMNSIMGFASLLADNFDDKESLVKFSEIINLRCNDLLAIIDDILDISKIESGQSTVHAEQFNINMLFNELETFFLDFRLRANKQQIKLLFHTVVDEFAIVNTDKTKLKQILINLINNAFRFTQSGVIECGCRTNEHLLQFFVSDTGIGIPKEKYDFVFERFAQIKQPALSNVGGTGLGLSIVKGLTNLLGGEVWLESECGKGTTFYFTINPLNIEKTSSIINRTISYS